MYSVVKHFEFEAAHKLECTENEGCKRIHGHTYKLDVEVRSVELTSDMVMDFTKLSRIVKEVIINVFDHKLILKNEIVAQYSVTETKVLMTEQPTAERMCRLFYEMLLAYIPNLHKVRLWETTNSYAEYWEEYK